MRLLFDVVGHFLLPSSARKKVKKAKKLAPMSVPVGVAADGAT
jgi:hypothetical protein